MLEYITCCGEPDVCSKWITRDKLTHSFCWHYGWYSKKGAYKILPAFQFASWESRGARRNLNEVWQSPQFTVFPAARTFHVSVRMCHHSNVFTTPVAGERFLLWVNSAVLSAASYFHLRCWVDEITPLMLKQILFHILLNKLICEKLFNKFLEDSDIEYDVIYFFVCEMKGWFYWQILRWYSKIASLALKCLLNNTHYVNCIHHSNRFGLLQNSMFDCIYYKILYLGEYSWSINKDCIFYHVQFLLRIVLYIKCSHLWWLWCLSF